MINLALLVALLLPAVTAADPVTYTALNTSREMFPAEAPLDATSPSFRLAVWRGARVAKGDGL